MNRIIPDFADRARADLFRHVTADKAALYRAIMDTFAAAKRQFRLHLRPDEVRAAAQWPGEPPPLEEIQQALAQLVEWGNLRSQPDTARVTTLEDFYRARFLYSLTSGGEAVESGLAAFAEALARRGELQSVALEDILGRLSALSALAEETPLDAAKVHESLRDLVHVFSSLAENAQAFMASLARSIELQRADLQAVLAYKARLIDYLERFISDLVTRSGRIAQQLDALAPHAEKLLDAVAAREARDAAPDDASTEAQVLRERLHAWRERWSGLQGWFVGSDRSPPQAELLRSRARSAIPQLLAAVAALNERRSGRSDRSADFRILAHWFAETESDGDAHRLWRAAFALNSSRHLSLISPDTEIAASTSWADAAPIEVAPRLRERGQLVPRGAPPRMQDRSRERALLAERLKAEYAQVQAARMRLANGGSIRLSQLGRLDRHEFRLFIALLGEALAVQGNPDQAVERVTADGLLRLRLEPLGAQTHARIETELGSFSGRDHTISITEIKHQVRQ
ncbi:MAG: TIGR02677 family protein [Betaproteobacteria bacterium RIFCSPLOWO2_12_FULL_62_13]|nr:MAG: TIGR02677 family protein [Betaproteobacteria bacterium RIFCSPLOWO2_12_FULL_62_13]